MKGEFYDFCKLLVDDVPHDVYEITIIIFCAGTITAFGLKGWQKGFRLSMALLLLEFVFLIYGTTVFFRETMVEKKYNFTPFWSYSVDRLILENIMNVVVFVPIGLLAGVAFRGMTWKKNLVIGLGLSVGIEVLQFVFRKGFSEVDDVIHNTFGCLIGYFLWLLLKKIGRCSLNYCKSLWGRELY